MKVRELVRLLQQFDGEIDVVCPLYESRLSFVTTLRLGEVTDDEPFREVTDEYELGQVETITVVIIQ